jgi:hypothetical protein
LDSPQFIDDFDNIDLHRARADAAPAPDTAWPAVFGHEPSLFVVKAVLDAAGPAFPEVLSPGYQGVGGKQTGIPRAIAPSLTGT